MAASPLSTKASIGLTKRIPGGEYRMGSRFHPREERRVVQVAEFQLAHVPVTVSQYAAFVESKQLAEERWWSAEGWLWLTGKTDGWGRVNRLLPENWEAQQARPFHPVTGVCAYEAEAYCAWISAQKNKRARLPSEQEWEFAARGEDGRPFPWGEEFDAALANTVERQLGETVEPASIPGDVSPFEVMDLCGNVQEWTGSLYIPIPGEVVPAWSLRVARGGSFNDTSFGARTSYRRGYPPGYFFPFLGFRLALDG
jgi:formylglycine-generating enzyme required for sulfatase activity